jgi:hypothetical protein
MSPAAAIACYCAGMLIETLGLALIAAYGLVLTGGPLIVGGIVLGTFGNRLWPAPERTPATNYLKDYLRAGRR